MYLIQIDHLIYEPKGGGAFTLGQAWRELHGVGNCRILRERDLTTVARRGLNTPWYRGESLTTIRAALRHQRLRPAIRQHLHAVLPAA